MSPATTTTYYVRSEGGCTLPGVCTSVNVIVKTVNSSVTLSGSTLTADLAGATYQWINCTGNADISGAISQSFAPAESGSYSVRITSNGCTAVSSCTSVTVCKTPVVSSLVVSASEICSGGSSTITVNGDLRDATAWHLYSGSCDGTPVSSNTTGVFVVSPAANTTYYVRGEGGCIVAGTCSSAGITIKAVNTATTLVGSTITATATGTTYQWINCTGNTNIAGETSRTFAPQQSGSYSVRITENGCTAISSCVDVVIVGIEDSYGDKITVYPNPISTDITIELPVPSKNILVDITDATGKSVLRKTYKAAKTIEMDVRSLSPGIYFINVNTSDIRSTIKVIVK